MPTIPPVDESCARLHRAGWSVGENGSARGWYVTGSNGENRIEARGYTLADAWHRAVEQAQAVRRLR